MVKAMHPQHDADNPLQSLQRAWSSFADLFNIDGGDETTERLQREFDRREAMEGLRASPRKALERIEAAQASAKLERAGSQRMAALQADEERERRVRFANLVAAEAAAEAKAERKANQQMAIAAMEMERRRRMAERHLQVPAGAGDCKAEIVPSTGTGSDGLSKLSFPDPPTTIAASPPRMSGCSPSRHRLSQRLLLLWLVLACACGGVLLFCALSTIDWPPVSPLLPVMSTIAPPSMPPSLQPPCNPTRPLRAGAALSAPRAGKGGRSNRFILRRGPHHSVRWAWRALRRWCAQVAARRS